jgi:phage gp29-like protein
VLDLLDAIPKGYSMMEIVWDASRGEARIQALRWIHPKKITFWDSITPRVLTEDEPVRGADPPPFKCVYHRCRARSGYDTRAGLMRVCAWMYLFKNYAVKDWVAFAEVFGMPLRIGKYEPGASKADREALVHAVRSLGSDAAGIISKSTEIEFVEAQKGSSQNVYESLASFCDAQMSKAILGQTLTSEAGGGKGQGSYALGRVHSGVRQDLIEADCRALGKTITEQVLRPLVGFNFGWDAPVPRFRFLYEPPEDLKAAAETYKILADLGFDFSSEHISERFKIPVRKPEETPLSDL